MQDQQLESIEFHHVPAQFRQPVIDWFSGRLAALAVDGSRSVRLPHPQGGERQLKLKGAGFMGGPVRFGVYHRSGPKAPVFDFDGRMMEDVASGHDGAPSGGCSFQQAATEYHVTRRVTAAGYAAIPCLGYGRIRKDGLSSWFSLFDHEPGLATELIYPDIDLGGWIDLNAAIGPVMADLAVAHDLIGYCWYAIAPDGRRLLRDLHPYRFADPLNMSQVSWVMQLFYAMHIRGNAQRLRALKWNEPAMPPDLHVWQYRPFCPEVRLADHDALRENLVVPYMLGPPTNFEPDRLIAVLQANPITAGMLKACPPAFARI